MAGIRCSRRRLLLAGASLLAAGPAALRAQQQVPIADMHSHYGLIARKIADSGLAEEIRAQRVALVAWKLVADGRWIRATSTGIEQRSEPRPGELARYFDEVLRSMRSYVAEQKLRLVLSAADVDACVAGEPGIVLASEGADFLEGRLEGLDAAHEKGLRHLQLVHYIRTPVGDFQTVAPTHGGLSEMGRKLVEACNAKGILVDLAHSTIRRWTRRWRSPGRRSSGRTAGWMATAATGATRMDSSSAACRSRTRGKLPRAAA